LRPPPEAELVAAGKLTMGQLAQAHRDRLETGRPVLDIVVERGWVPSEDVAALREAHGIEAPAPAIQAVPEPEPEEEAPAPAAAQERYKIAIRLNNGDLITAGETDGADKAVALGHAVVAELTQENGEWPFFGGRFINPETIVSVDLLPEDPAG
jgi:cytochrome oxidase assembly protein ShyY1